MTKETDSRSYYDTLPKRTSFGEMTDPANYMSLPDDWVVGVSDIVGSTLAVAAGRYKTVNMIGAAVISAQINGAQGRDFPYIFWRRRRRFCLPAGPSGASQFGALRRAMLGQGRV